MKAFVSESLMSDGHPVPFGLLDVRTEDGRVFADLTRGQLFSLMVANDWELERDEEHLPSDS